MEATPIGGPPVFVLEAGWLVFNCGIRGIDDAIGEMDGHKLYRRRGDVESDANSCAACIATPPF